MVSGMLRILQVLSHSSQSISGSIESFSGISEASESQLEDSLNGSLAFRFTANFSTINIKRNVDV